MKKLWIKHGKRYLMILIVWNVINRHILYGMLMEVINMNIKRFVLILNVEDFIIIVKITDLK